VSVPHLNELHQKYSGQGLAILALTSEERETVESFVKDNHMAYAIGLDEADRTCNQYGVEGVPSVFLIGTDGKVVWEGHPLELREEQVKALLPVPSKQPANGSKDERDEK
jgi:peroxiredoxin